MSYINTINNDNTNYLIAGVSNIIVCSTSASTVAKTATAMDGFSLDSNLSFKIIFTNGNTASSPTLNLNSTGAKSLTTTTSDYTLVKNMLYDCYYNGTSYVLDNTVTVHTANTSNPHSVTKAQVGLGNCDNTADSNKAVSSASKLTTARKTYVTLGTASTTTTRDWSGDTTIPVSGILGVANGGTGASSLSSITVGNSSKLGNYSVKTSSIGGNSTESTNYWTYVTKSKFTSTGGYIKYSNGLLIQWKKDDTSIGTDALKTISLPTDFPSTNYILKPNLENASKGADDVHVRVVSKATNEVTVKTRRSDSQSAGTRYVTFIAIGY